MTRRERIIRVGRPGCEYQRANSHSHDWNGDEKRRGERIAHPPPYLALHRLVTAPTALAYASGRLDVVKSMAACP